MDGPTTGWTHGPTTGRTLAAVPLLVWSLAACSDPAEEPWNPEAVRAEVVAFVDRYVAHTNDFDPAALVELYSASEDFFWVEANRDHVYESRDEVAEGLASLQGFDEILLTVSDVRVAPLGPGAAAVSFEFAESLTPPEGEPFVIAGVMSASVVREDGTWRFLTGHATASVEN